MNTLDVTSRELEILQVQLAVLKTDANIARVKLDLANMEAKQRRRTAEIARQQALHSLAAHSPAST